MATGWPMKTTYANGDVYSASDVNDITGTINLLTSTTLSVSAAKNFAINGGMDIWQRGTSISISGASDGYTSDRWRLFTQANQASTVSRQATGDTTNLPSIQYCARVQRNSGQTGTGQISFIQGIETANSIPLAGKTVTLSFYARRGANFSPTSNTFNFLLYTGTGTDQFPTAYTGGTSVATATNNLTTTWTRYSVTGTISATATEIGLYAYWSATGTAGAADYVEITGVQLELGSTATTFSRAGGTIQGELAACQRYYEKSILQGSTPGGTNTGEMWFPNASIANGETWQLVRFSVTKRTSPTVTTYSYSGTSGRAANDSGTNYGADSANVWRNGDSYAVIKNNSGSSLTVTSVRWVYCNWVADAEL